MSTPETNQAMRPKDGQGLLTASRLHQLGLLNGAKRYLEIGVFKGATFLNVEIPIADAVDPAFQFDVATFARPGTRYLQKTSDSFFREDMRGQQYDLIFLDGLHTFEQCFRDFCATMALSHAKTIWLIDDTVPDDAFSIRKNMSETLLLRKAHGLTSQSWHGDVFKVLFAIHDFFPTFDYRTVLNAGNPQTVLMRSVRKDFAPRWNDLVKISNFDFVDFLNNRDIVKQATQVEMLAWAKEVMENSANDAA